MEPEQAAILSGKEVGSHLQMGIGDGLVPKILNQQIYDDIVIITDEEALKTAKDRAAQEGLVGGITGDRGKTIVTILPDTAERYFSTPLFDEQ